MSVARKLQFIEALEMPERNQAHVGRRFASPPKPIVRDDTPTQDNVPTADPRQPSGFIDNGSLVSFLAGVDRQSQADVLNSMLLAQLAANKKFDREADTVGWYGFYHDVLENLGWVVQQFAFSKYDVAGSTVTVDKVVREVLAAIATENGAAVVKVLERPAINDTELAAARDSLRRELVSTRQSRFFTAYMNKAKTSLTINRYPDVVARASGL
jgi:hypothetical protein